MNSLRPGFKALVIGASGGIGATIAAALENDPRCGRLYRLSRRENTGFDICDEASIALEAKRIRVAAGNLDLVFNATGALEIDAVGPEKTLKSIDAHIMGRQFDVNAIGVALLIKHFAPLLPRDRRSLFASLSARVGSIGDNSVGGWISYRASKAAQNQIIKTASIEIGRTHPLSVLVALHPGTVATRLSEPYSANRKRTKPQEAAGSLLKVLDSLDPSQSGGFYAYDGAMIEW